MVCTGKLDSFGSIDRIINNLADKEDESQEKWTSLALSTWRERFEWYFDYEGNVGDHSRAIDLEFKVIIQTWYQRGSIKIIR